jgi:hypothetical protein
VIALGVALGAASTRASAAPADDPLAAYLERLGLDGLLVEHLARRLGEGALPDERGRIVERLAELYPALLERTVEPGRRDALVQAAAAFLAAENPKEPEALQLALLRARYRAAARVAEDRRAALVEPAEAAAAASALAEVIRESSQMRARLETRLRDLERKSERASGLEGERAIERSDRMRGKVQEAASLEAWAQYYQSTITGERAAAEAAQPLFAKVLDTGQAFPNPKDVSVDLRSNEFFANAVLGMALAKSRTESLATTLEWLALLDDARVPEGIRRQLPAWRIVAAGERSDWARAREFLGEALRDPQVPIPWLRLAAVLGLGNATGSAEAAALAREAIAALASRREFGQLTDLSKRFGDEVLAGRGFVPRYVRGTLAYERGRAAKERGDATAAAAAFAEAAGEFEAALGDPDGANFAAALSGCRSLAAWSRFERGEFDAAARLFAQASDADPRAEEPAWMVLVSVEKAFASESDASRKAILEGELRSRIDRFLAGFPSSDKVPQLLSRRLRLNDAPRLEDLERLLVIDPSAKGGADARRQALGGLYRLARAASGEERERAIARFVQGARTFPAPEGGLAGLPGGDVTIARQGLEIATLAEGPERAAAIAWASDTLAALDALAAAKRLDTVAIAGELAARRVQVALGQDNLEEAMARLAALDDATDDASRRAADLARRHLFRYAGKRLRDGGAAAGPDRAALIAAVLRTGEPLLAAAESSAGSMSKALGDPVIESLAAVTIDAAAEAAETTGIPDGAAIAGRFLPTAKVLAERRPRDPQALAALATLAEAVGEISTATESLRRIVSGTPFGSERWYRAKVRLVEILAKVDPDRAKQVLVQHRQLIPDWGPAPWGERLRSAAEALGVGDGGTPPPPGEAGP